MWRKPISYGNLALGSLTHELTTPHKFYKIVPFDYQSPLLIYQKVELEYRHYCPSLRESIELPFLPRRYLERKIFTLVLGIRKGLKSAKSNLLQ